MKPIVLKFICANGKISSAKLFNVRFDGKAIRGQEKIRGVFVNRSILPSELSLNGLEKSVNYSYPSSNNADQFGLKYGGFCVAVGEPNQPAYSICGFASRQFAD